jgi:hypothetical protein
VDGLGVLEPPSDEAEQVAGEPEIGEHRGGHDDTGVRGVHDDRGAGTVWGDGDQIHRN